MLYLYAIIDQPAAPPFAEPGLGDAGESATRPYSLSYQDIAAVVSPLAARTVPPTTTNIWDHEAVVEGLMSHCTVLPLRFGTVFNDAAAVQAVLAEHYAHFVAGLDRVRGRVELGLRVLWHQEPHSEVAADRGSAPAEEPGSGRAYLLARLAEERQQQARRQPAEALAVELHAPLAGRAVESTSEVWATPHLLLTAAYLVDQDQVPAFQEEIRALIAAYPTLRFLCTGPWPPYSFVASVPNLAAVASG
ncbi:MAG: GvpL/GvpF family gas vesicle protein [Chloroflexi bacterium]|nr:GvpL/GvpF family gas vesicle protein [Chloroflexota bacterium]MBU1746909.1 GvpL/GvpF family gas vesicle protein [Chloroflexota bacterium]MBU1880368.1 GvpL/GvpF family gas vesicle protein [Chloroflexota bacterium]